MSLENSFDITFAATQALREKQIQQSYRPVIGVHKWFARRPGTLFRNLLLAEFNGRESLEKSFFKAHDFRGVIADPFMGGGTPLIEANRLGFHVIGADINPMAHWIVKQELGPFNNERFASEAARIVEDVRKKIGHFCETRCLECGSMAPVKYFIWVKTQECSHCHKSINLFPGYLLAEATRHPKHVIACSECLTLVELERQPSSEKPAECPKCKGRVQVDGPAKRNHIACPNCKEVTRYPAPKNGVPQHRLWALEYNCESCKPHHSGRFFKSPSKEDLKLYDLANRTLQDTKDLPIPSDKIPPGDETNRLLRWGYIRYRDLFNARQLLGLGLLLQRIQRVCDQQTRYALLTVFSDFLRYQNMLCRYDTYALKCQDIFSVHSFPVGLVQCENSLLGIDGIGSGGFLHFIEKYRRAKNYCSHPFETQHDEKSKRKIFIEGERISAEAVDSFPKGNSPQAQLICAPSAGLKLKPNSLDGVFTDPPYFANVQYAELMDFCFSWLRKGLKNEHEEFMATTTRAANELTGNATLGRTIEDFTEGLSSVFSCFATALKNNAPFVFTFHHNNIRAYAPLVVALLDADLYCTAVLPAPAEMGASLHINNTSSSTLDSIFVSRKLYKVHALLPTLHVFNRMLNEDYRKLAEGGVVLSEGDKKCIFSGQIARLCVQHLYSHWDKALPLKERFSRVQDTMAILAERYQEKTLQPVANGVGRNNNVVRSSERYATTI